VSAEAEVTKKRPVRQADKASRKVLGNKFIPFMVGVRDLLTGRLEDLAEYRPTSS